MFKVEKNVPLPVKAGFKYPFSVMDVGDSFLVPCVDEDKEKFRAAIRAASYQYRRRNRSKWRFKPVAVEGGVRTWRIE